MPVLGLMARMLTGRYRAHGDLAQADCVLTMSFKPPTNFDLAALANSFGLPMLLPDEVACHVIPSTQEVHVMPHGVDTAEAVEWARGKMNDVGYHVAILLALPAHLPRADLVCRRVGLVTVVPKGVGRVVRHGGNSHLARWKLRELRMLADEGRLSAAPSA